MRRMILAVSAALAVLAAGMLAPSRAEAMTVSTPAGIAAAVGVNKLTENVAYVCRRVWRCGPYGCGWRQSCSWSSPRYYAPRYYAPRHYYSPRHRYYAPRYRHHRGHRW